MHIKRISKGRMGICIVSVTTATTIIAAAERQLCREDIAILYLMFLPFLVVRARHLDKINFKSRYACDEVPSSKKCHASAVKTEYVCHALI